MDTQSPDPRRISLQVLAMGVIGAGLLVLGFASWLLPLLSSGGGSQQKKLAAAPEEVNYAAPSVRLTNLQGQSVSLADYQGQVVLVNHWATWCPPCKAEMPALQAYYNKHKTQGFVVIAIEAGEPADEVAEFVRQNSLTFPVWPDPDQQAVRAFKQILLPSSYILDRTGQVRLAWSGETNLDLMEKHITPLLEK